MDNKLKIINYLGKHIKENFTMHELSKFLFVPYATFYRTLDGMIDLIAKEKKGNTILVRLKLDNPIISSYLAISSEEAKKEYLDKHPIINKILNEFRDMLRDKEENVGKQVLKDHIILNNPKEFWECVLNAVR